MSDGRGMTVWPDVPHETSATGRMPPHSIEAEQSIIGSLLLDNNSVDRIHWLSASDFYSFNHRALYTAIRNILESGQSCDSLLLAEALKSRGELEACGGNDYIVSLVVNTPSSANIHNYAAVVHKRAQARELQALAADLSAEAQTGNHDPVKLAETVADRALAVIDATGGRDITHFSKAVADAVDWLDAPVKGISTGYSSLDSVIGGLRPSELIVVAGRPSMGKTSLAINIAEHVAHQSPVALFSLEMTARQIGARSVRWHEHLTDRVSAVTRLMDLKLWIDDSPKMTIGMMRVRLQRIKRKHGLALVVVDYLQMMSGEGENRTQQIGSLSRGLKALAKEFQVPVIAVASLNRGVEARQDKRPLMSDLRESGDIESDCDVCVMLYRDEYYTEDSYAKGYCEALVRKHRDGPVGASWLIFVPEYARFRDFTGQPPRAPAVQRAPSSGTVRSVDFKKQAAGDDSA